MSNKKVTGVKSCCGGGVLLGLVVIIIIMPLLLLPLVVGRLLFNNLTHQLQGRLLDQQQRLLDNEIKQNETLLLNQPLSNNYNTTENK
jgi:hypothetical protein